MKKYNLGCGKKYIKGYINVDVTRSVKADLYFNLNKFPYPIKKKSADEVLMDNVLEHLDDVVLVMEEIYRILKPGGIVKIYLPYAKSDGALQDPTHKHLFTEKSMDYFRQDDKYNYYTNAKFRILVSKPFNANKTLLSKMRVFIPFKPVLKYFLLNIYDGLYFEMKAVK
ncbi:MAG: Methyltransferase domain protein [Candidatus Woesebacteria bacterium GW2011_GWA1_39_21]|uniref:Methyltransferase domain protein n=1 Tax=Candidatus Woesebacteria bacterium GW2011_GWA1_39_21 TaxID=1618550 RepID=A0A0G0REA8_9BACT|nr:MAG: Methyltransferase domain protein [Candidatus Woesebacteria bacterium GW2011_GWA1_39_21]